MKFEKILILILTTILLTINIYSYNATYSNITINPNSWCEGLPATITIYNQTDYNNKEKIKDKLCGVNETYAKTGCLTFSKLSGKVQVYKGPLEGLGILEEKTIGSNNEINITFPTENEYLFKVIPTGKYNEFETLFYANKCKYAASSNPTSSSSKPVKLYNLTLNDANTNTFIKIENTEINSSNNLIVSQISDLKLRNLPELKYNILKTIEIKGLTEIKNYTSLTIDTQLPTRDSTLSIFYYENSKWNKIINLNDYNNKIVIQNAKLGIYSIVGNEIKEEPKTITQTATTNSTQTSNNNQQENLNTSQVTNPLLLQNQKINTTPSNITSFIVWVIILLLVVTLISIAVWQHRKEEPSLKDNKENSKHEPQTLRTISDIYSKAKEYVTKYKTQFTKDQLYRALQNANVPKDIIDKVFSEEF